MNRARNELASVTNAIDEHAERVERELARRRWRMDLELELLLVRAESTAARRLMNG